MDGWVISAPRQAGTRSVPVFPLLGNDGNGSRCSAREGSGRLGRVVLCRSSIVEVPFLARLPGGP